MYILYSVYITLATRNRLYLLLYKNGKKNVEKKHIITIIYEKLASTVRKGNYTAATMIFLRHPWISLRQTKCTSSFGSTKTSTRMLRKLHNWNGLLKSFHRSLGRSWKLITGCRKSTGRREAFYEGSWLISCNLQRRRIQSGMTPIIRAKSIGCSTCSS